MNAAFKKLLGLEGQHANSRYDLLTLFTVMLGFYGLMNNLFLEPYPAPWKFLTLGAAMGMILFPGRPLLLLAFAVFSILEYWFYAPLFSNHMFIGLLLWIYITASWIYCAVKQKHIHVEAETFYNTFAPPARLALLTMYFFGVFHKINAPFLTPEVSCASALLQYFIFIPADTVYPKVVQSVAAYGTLVIETLIALLLLFPRTRYFAVIGGVAFHILISTSTYRYYVPFTLLSITMHTLYFDPGMLGRIKDGIVSKLMDLHETIWPERLLLAMPVLFGFVYYASLFDSEDFAAALWVWAVFALALTAVIIVYDKPKEIPPCKKGYFCTPLRGLTVLAALFFLSCFSPYFGFKTSHTINMFSNLHTEGGHSNHYVFQKPLYLFDYQNDLVRILDTDDEALKLMIHPDLAMIGFQFESYMLENPDAWVKYERGGEVSEIKGLTEGMKAKFYKPLWQRKFMLFTIVNTAEPATCLDVPDMARIHDTPHLERWFRSEIKNTDSP